MIAFDMPHDDISIQKNNISSAYEYFHPTNKLAASFDIKNMLAIIKVKPPKKQNDYSNLPGYHQIDQDKIIELFTIIGSHNKATLLFKYKSHCTKLGDQIKHVHPLKMIGVIFSKPHMKPYMSNLYNDYWKWKMFYQDFEGNMNHELLKNNIDPYINDFAKDVNVPKNEIMPFFNRSDWKGLIEYLINH